MSLQINILDTNYVNEENIIYEEDLISEIQYSMGLPSGLNKTTCTYLGDIAVIKKDRTCYGVKMCEFADSELQEMKHKSVDPESDLRLKMIT
ncbi:12840_t:CDS:2 [Funneliformis mosseae]|uniref:12840_t:CDS:1 n=1 Tax=Funneliformis mosseae TaxID=27381 RepID=A0A9N9ES39_FUNMO|nr:12840_t:CDS:2 [Funneliformis mosseae]